MFTAMSICGKAETARPADVPVVVCCQDLAGTSSVLRFRLDVVERPLSERDSGVAKVRSSSETLWRVFVRCRACTARYCYTNSAKEVMFRVTFRRH